MSTLDDLPIDFIKSQPFPKQLLLSQSAYYPACGFDMDFITHFSGQHNSFVYVDFAISRSKCVEAFGNLPDFDLLFQKELSLHELSKSFSDSEDYINRDTQSGGIQFDLGERFAYWKVYQQRFLPTITTKPRKLSLLFIGGEGQSVYKSLYVDNNLVPEALAIIQPGTGFGGNWTDFRTVSDPFGRTVLNNPRGTPDNIYYGGIGTSEYDDLEYPGYQKQNSIANYYSNGDDGTVSVYRKTP